MSELAEYLSKYDKIKVPQHRGTKTQHRGTKTPLRGYQMRAFDFGKCNNAIIVLPTGAGKTLISAAICSQHLERGSTKRRVLFLVPTCLLVPQQANALSYETGKVVAEYMGGYNPPTLFDILVSTPASFIVLCDSNCEFQLSNFGLVVFDEVHHVIRNHPYRSIARRISGVQMTSSIQILGLSASLTYAVSATTIQKNVNELCAELNVSGDCIFTSSTEELQRDGYHGSISKTTKLFNSEIEIDLLANPDDPDSKDDSMISCNDALSEETLEIPGRVHEGLSNFLTHVKNKTPPIHPLSLCLMDTIASIEHKVKQLDNSFQSPIGAKGKHSRVSSWGEYVYNKIKSLQKHNNKFSFEIIRFYKLLEHLYEAVRLIINSRQVSLELAFHYLVMSGLMSDGVVATDVEILPLQSMWHEYANDFNRLHNLGEILLQQLTLFNNKSKTNTKEFSSSSPSGSSSRSSLRAIVFVQQRVTTHICKHYIDTHPRSPLLRSLQTNVLYATSSSATAALSVNATQSKQRVEMFARGDLSVIFATSVAEEGMDIPAANCVIRFDAIQTPVSLVQSRGRARQEDSSFVVMSESKDTSRSLESLQQCEHNQLALIKEMSLQASEGNSNGVDQCNEINAKRIQAQDSRIKSAASVLVQYFTSITLQKQEVNATSVLKNYAQKVAGEVTERATVVNKKVLPQQFEGIVTLNQFHVQQYTGIGMGLNKKEAIRNACHNLLTKIN